MAILGLGQARYRRPWPKLRASSREAMPPESDVGAPPSPLR
jgi:hypothetical protein